MTTSVCAGSSCAVSLVLTAAEQLGPPCASVSEEQAHAWRDAAVVSAVGQAWLAGDARAVVALADMLGPLLRTVPVVAGRTIELRPVGIGERRRRGAFATPPALAAVLARRALAVREGGTGAGGPVVDPACGAGALLRATFAELVGAGLSAADAAGRLHGVDSDPVAVEVCRAVLAVDACAAGHPCSPEDFGAQVVVGDALVDGPQFAWATAFPASLARSGVPPDNVTGWRGGFAAVVANPPWERLKVLAKDWADAAPDGLREGRAAAARAVRGGGRHPLTGAGELNAYLPFVETCWRLLGAGGRASLLVPAGVATDRSAGRLMGALVSGGVLERLQVLAPGTAAFEGVTSRVPVAIVDLRRRVAATSGSGSAEIAVDVERPDVLPAPRSWRLDAPTLHLVNPNTTTLPVCAGPEQMALLTAAHRCWPVLVERDEHGQVISNPWSLRFVTPLHMTRDAPSFRRAPGTGLVPLLEAKHAGLLDHRGGSAEAVRYWVPEALMEARYAHVWRRGWLAGYRNVTTADAARTLLPAALPLAGVGNSLPLLSAPRLALLLTGLASLPVDFLTRCKHAGANLNFFKVEQIPLPRPEAYDAPAPWDPSRSTAEWLLERFAAATRWDESLGGLAAEVLALGVDPGLVATRSDAPASLERRGAALAEIDAAHALLLGWTCDDLASALSTFPALRARETRQYGSFVTGDRMKEAYDRLSRRVAPGQRR